MENNNHNIPKLEGTNAVQDYLNGMSTKKIADKYGVSRPAVSNFLKKKGVDVKARYVKISQYSFDEHWLDKMDTAEKWYFLGFMYADGNVNITSGNYRVRIKLKADEPEKELLEYFNKLLKSDREISYSESFNKTYQGIEKSYTFSLGGKYFTERMIELGCVPNKTLVLKYPTDIPLKFVSHFIRGYFDGDGNIQLRYEGKVGDIRILGTKSMVNGIYDAVKKAIGVEGTCKKYGDKAIWSYDIDGQNNIKDFLNWLYSDCTICLSRKKALADKFLITRDFSKKTRMEKHQILLNNFEKIKERRNNGETLESIAKSFECNRNAIAKLLKSQS